MVVYRPDLGTCRPKSSSQQFRCGISSPQGFGRRVENVKMGGGFHIVTNPKTCLSCFLILNSATRNTTVFAADAAGAAADAGPAGVAS